MRVMRFGASHAMLGLLALAACGGGESRQADGASDGTEIDTAKPDAADAVAAADTIGDDGDDGDDGHDAATTPGVSAAEVLFDVALEAAFELRAGAARSDGGTVLIGMIDETLTLGDDTVTVDPEDSAIHSVRLDLGPDGAIERLGLVAATDGWMYDVLPLEGGDIAVGGLGKVGHVGGRPLATDFAGTAYVARVDPGGKARWLLRGRGDGLQFGKMVRWGERIVVTATIGTNVGCIESAEGGPCIPIAPTGPLNFGHSQAVVVVLSADGVPEAVHRVGGDVASRFIAVAPVGDALWLAGAFTSYPAGPEAAFETTLPDPLRLATLSSDDDPAEDTFVARLVPGQGFTAARAIRTYGGGRPEDALVVSPDGGVMTIAQTGAYTLVFGDDDHGDGDQVAIGSDGGSAAAVGSFGADGAVRWGRALPPWFESAGACGERLCFIASTGSEDWVVDPGTADALRVPVVEPAGALRILGAVEADGHVRNVRTWLMPRDPNGGITWPLGSYLGPGRWTVVTRVGDAMRVVALRYP